MIPAQLRLFSLKELTAILLISAALTSPTRLMATNGYSPTGFGAINKGMAGAGVALPQDTLSAATNPAGMALVGHRLDIGAALFSPSNRGFTANDDATSPFQITPGDYTSSNDLFLIPHFGWNKPLSGSSSIGVSIGANGGMNTEYDSAVFGNFGPATAPTGVDFAQLFLGVTYAHQITERQWLGIMPILAYQRFKAEGLEPFNGFTTAPGKVSNNGYDTATGYGLRIGWLGHIHDNLTLGISWQSKLDMDEFEDYAGLFAEQGDFDTPSTWVIGFDYRISNDLNLLIDFQRINYGEINSLANANNIDLFSDPSGLLGADGGLGFGWNDIDIIKLGLQIRKSPRLSLRLGYSHATELFDNGQALFNILAPATVRDHFSFGSTYQLSKESAINMAFTRALNERIEGSNPVFTPGQSGSLQMEQWEVEISWSRHF